MGPPYLSILGLTVSTSLLGLIGGFVLLWREATAMRWSSFLVSFGAGGILGATFLELLPEAIAESSDVNKTILFVLLGIIVFFVVEKLLVWHHHAHEHGVGEDDRHLSQFSTTAVRPLIIVGDALHNFLDGAVIAIAFLVNAHLGLITALAVLVHELPQEIGDFGILLHSGMRRGSVALWNVVGALVSPLGATVAFFANEKFTGLQVPLLAFAAGNFVYIALADLLPSIQRQTKLGTSLGQLTFFLLGIWLIWQLGLFLPE